MILKRRDDETLNDVITRHGDIVHLKVARAVCDALDAGEERAYVLTVIPDHYELFCTKSNYKDSLILNLPYIEELEEFELCQRIQNWISKLKYDEYKDLIEKTEITETPKKSKKKK
jgi:hypothetical protein